MQLDFSTYFCAYCLGCLEEYACLWNGCEFLAMGSPAELEVHAFFHNYHSKLKFFGSQLLKSRPDLPSCNQGLHGSNQLPEASDGYVCQWEHCDVGVFYFKLFTCHVIIHIATLTPGLTFFVCIQSTFNNPEWFYRHVDNHVDSAEQQCLSQQQQALFCNWAGMTE